MTAEVKLWSLYICAHTHKDPHKRAAHVYIGTDKQNNLNNNEFPSFC